MASSVFPRFWSKVRKTPSCWLWTAATDGGGYGKFSIKDKDLKAHRVAWKLSGHSIPPEKWILHRCHNRRCIRPSHLYVGDRSRNVRDAVVRGTHGSLKLDPKKLAKLFQLRDAGFSQKAIGRRLGVSQARVYQVLRDASY